MSRSSRHHQNGSFGKMTPADMANALAAGAAQREQQIEFSYEHMHAPLAQPVAATILNGNKITLIAVGGIDHVTKLAHDLFVQSGGSGSPEQCIARAQEFYRAVGAEAARMQAEMAAKQAMPPEQDDSPSGIVLP